MTHVERRRLNSWKEISDYLGREIRTVSRWERERGLPVRRVPGGKGHSVFAYSDELDAWLAGQSSLRTAAAPADATTSNAMARLTRAVPQPWRRTVLALAVVALLGGLTAVAVGVRTRPLDVRTFAIRGSTIAALDGEAREVWSHELEGEVRLPAAKSVVDDDVDGDDGREIVAGLSLALTPLESRDLLVRFDNNGTRRWSRSLSDSLTFGAGEYGPPWKTGAVFVYGVEGETRIAWTMHHRTWWPSILAVLDAEGRLLSRFANAGWMMALNITADQRHLLVGGWSNEHDGTILAALDVHQPTGSSPESPGSQFECLTCPAGRPVRYFVMPRPELATLTGYRMHTPLIDVTSSGTIEVRGRQNPLPSESAEIVYEFSPSLTPVRATASDAYWDWHRQLEADGKVDHDAAICPERNGFTVRQWDRAGWPDVAAPPAIR